MVYAQIINNTICNLIVLEDASLIPLFTQGFDALIEVPYVAPSTEIGAPQMPTIGWTYDGTNFNPPK